MLAAESQSGRLPGWGGAWGDERHAAGVSVCVPRPSAPVPVTQQPQWQVSVSEVKYLELIGNPAVSQ